MQPYRYKGALQALHWVGLSEQMSFNTLTVTDKNTRHKMGLPGR